MQSCSAPWENICSVFNVRSGFRLLEFAPLKLREDVKFLGSVRFFLGQNLCLISENSEESVAQLKMVHF